LNIDLTMLADVDHGVAISYGLLFRVPEETKSHYARLGYDLGHRHGTTEWMLPIPATYVIDQDGVVKGAFAELDFTIRQEPSDILTTVRQLAGAQAEDVTKRLQRDAFLSRDNSAL
jgi:peroxiredoxin